MPPKATTHAVNPLVSLASTLDGARLAAIAAWLGRFGVQGLVIAARGYLGPLAYRVDTGKDDGQQATNSLGLTPLDLAVLALAVSKLAFEIGELALYNPTVDAAGKLPDFELDEENHAPALSLAHVIAAVRWWDTYVNRRAPATDTAWNAKPSAAPAALSLTAARTARYAMTPRYSYAQPGTTMTKTTTRGCSSCGGSTSTPSPTPSPAPAPTPCGCGGGCGCSGTTGCGCGCATAAAPAPKKSYDSADCPTFAISCETKAALRDCAKVALCDFMRAIANTLCPGGRFDSNVFNNPDITKQLVDSVGQLACSFVHCVPDALCGPTCPPPATSCEPLCDYAVEVLR